MAEDLEILKEELEDEKDAILRACAQFGVFLKENSVLVYNDGMMGYLNLMIKQAREQGDQTEVGGRSMAFQLSHNKFHLISRTTL